MVTVTSVFVFCSNGTIPIAFFNVPGSVHDCQVTYWGSIFPTLQGIKLCETETLGITKIWRFVDKSLTRLHKHGQKAMIGMPT